MAQNQNRVNRQDEPAPLCSTYTSLLLCDPPAPHSSLLTPLAPVFCVVPHALCIYFWKPAKWKVKMEKTMNAGSQTNKKITTNSDKKMGDEKSLALKVISLEKSMGTVVKALKELRATVKTLEAKIIADHEDEIKEIKKNQELVESILAENTDAIKRIEL
jgi:septal ring factor EnvC (AmiA/AmiB activator)